ncbi:unnamed protein product [Acanthosepion pharaonis]|uniref:Uncharacterized protein n=1 Tax=Acanthosepion pharaonis TaxID=158019 RepID=A0A812CVB6_ACAPH|nr:unnamed protein product [Sepia pharaonis]
MSSFCAKTAGLLPNHFKANAGKSVDFSRSPHRKATRNAADDAANSIRRYQETTAEKTARNTAKAAATSIRRSLESMAEKTARHAADAAGTSAARALESSAQKRTWRQRDAISTSVARAVEVPTERLERLQTGSQRRHAQRGLCSSPKLFWFKLAFNYEPVLRLSGRKDLQIESMSVVFGHCNAKKSIGESAGLCRSDGKVQLPPFQELPAPWKALLEGSSPVSSQKSDSTTVPSR